MKFIASEITMLKALLILKAIVFTCGTKSNSLANSNSNTNSNKIRTLLNTRNNYLAYSKNSNKEQSNSQSLASLIIEQKEVLVLKQNSLLCDEAGYVCPFGFTCRKDQNLAGSEHRCVLGFKFLKEPCTGESGKECSEGLYCQRSERLAKLKNNGIIRLNNFHLCESAQEKLIELPHTINNFNYEKNSSEKNCNLINHVCPIGTFCNLNRDFEYVCESGSKRLHEQCLGKSDYCAENLACAQAKENFENSIGKRILAGNFSCVKEENEISKLFAGFKFFLEECEKEGIYGKNTCMFGARCADNYFPPGKSVCLRGKKSFKENCDANILPGDEIDCEKGLECKCVGHFFKSCKCEKSFRTEKNKIETKKFRVYKKLGR